MHIAKITTKRTIKTCPCNRFLGYKKLAFRSIRKILIRRLKPVKVLLLIIFVGKLFQVDGMRKMNLDAAAAL